MMDFRVIKGATTDLLGAAEAGRYRTIGYQVQASGADEVKDNLRTVQVFYNTGDFPKSGGSMDGPTLHEINLKIIMMVSKAVEVDLATLNNPASTALQLTTALAAAKYATKLADDSLDELWDIVYQELMDPRNENLGLDENNYTVENRWVDGFQKNEPIEYSSLVVLSAAANLSCRADERLTGDTLTAGEDIDTVVDVKDDDNEKTGVTVEV